MDKKVIGARVYSDRNIEIVPNTEVVIPFNQARYNYGVGWENTRLVAPEDGVYLIVAQCIWGFEILSIAGSLVDAICLQVTIKLNGEKCIATDRQSFTSFAPFNHCSTLWEMEKGDYVEMAVCYLVPSDYQIKSEVRRAEHWDSPEFMIQKL